MTDAASFDGVYLPLPPGHESAYTSLGTLTVDGERFAVRTRDSDGSFHYDWISGPNRGYGFSVSSGPASIDDPRHVAHIRGFLSGIDPATGYLD